MNCGAAEHAPAAAEQASEMQQAPGGPDPGEVPL